MRTVKFLVPMCLWDSVHEIHPSQTPMVCFSIAYDLCGVIKLPRIEGKKNATLSLRYFVWATDCTTEVSAPLATQKKGARVKSKGSIL